jgi:hypothetical protein
MFRGVELVMMMMICQGDSNSWNVNLEGFREEERGRERNRESRDRGPGKLFRVTHPHLYTNCTLNT